MPTYADYAAPGMKTFLGFMGVEFQYQNKAFKGLFEENILEQSETGELVRSEQPVATFLNSDGEFKYGDILIRKKDSQRFRVLDLIKDEVLTTRYKLEEVHA